MKQKNFTFLAVLLLTIMSINLNAQENGNASNPLASTIENPILFYIESASNGSQSVLNWTIDATGKVIYPAQVNQKMNYGDIPTEKVNALWAFISDGTNLKLYNKGTGFYLKGSHTATLSSDAAIIFTETETESLQYYIRTDDQGSYMLAWKNFTLDRWSTVQGANSLTAWYFILPKDISIAIDNATNVLANTVDDHFPTEVRETLQEAIETAQAIKDNSSATDTEKENAATTLNDAIITYYDYINSGEITINDINVIQDINYTGRGNDNEEILKIVISTQGDSETSINNLVLKMTGTTDINDVENIKLYTTENSNSFDPRDPLANGAKLLGDVIPSSGEITINTQGNLVSGDNILWLTYDVKNDAKEGNKIDAELVSITTANETYNFTDANPIGSREILLARTLVFAPGDYNSKNYRIPAICTAEDGTLVTLTDKRKNNSSDLPQDIDIVCRRSTDGGKTWSEALTVAEGTGLGQGYGDAVILKSNSGKIIALFVGGPGLWDSTPTNPMRAYMIESDDNGVTWTSPKDITSQIYGADSNDPERSKWQGMFFGSGHGLCTNDGRLMAVIAVRVPNENGLQNYTVYSDDDGQTWNVSNRAISGGDEAKVVELNNGDIIMSSRTSGNRLWAKSTDGGINWGPKNSWDEIWGNACDADIVRYTSTEDGYDKNRILHTLPNDPERRNVTMWISYDETQTWSIKKTICPGESAYSSITILDDGTIGVYLEEDNSVPYKMYFLNYSLNWLTDGSDSFTPKGTDVVEAPEMTPAGGRYGEPQSITITSLTEGATIHYTIDGTTPSSNSPIYTAAFELDHTATVKAIAVKEGMANSVVVSESYTIGWIVPGQAREVGDDRYVVSITTENADGNISFSADSAPSSHYVYYGDETINVNLGSTFTLNLEALKNQDDGLQWTQAIILADWNRDFTFTEDERIAIIGNEVTDNGNNVLSISQEITVPDDANTDANTRLRIVYTDGWRKMTGTYADLGEDPVDKGRMYDLNLKAKQVIDGVNSNQSNDFSISSNLINDNLTISFNKSDKYIISIFNVEGKIIQTKNIEGNQTSINFSDYDSNIYLVKVKNSFDQEKTYKIIKK